MGLCLLLNGAVGYALVALVLGVPSFPESLSGPTLTAGIMTLNLGSGALWWFTWRVFRPGTAWATLVFACAASLLFASLVGLASSAGLDRTSLHGVWYWVGFVTRAAAFAWSAIEALRYYRMMRRRAQHGLASRIDANVFLLWGTATTCAVLMYGFTGLGLILRGTSLPAPIVIGQCLAGLTAACAIWLAFLAPAWYKHLLQDRVEGMAGEARV